MTLCPAAKCDREGILKFKGKGKRYCRTHYQRIWKNGTIKLVDRFKPNEFIYTETYVEMCLYGRSGEVICKTKIDTEDVEKIKHLRWYKSRDDSVVNSKGYKHKILPRILINAPEDLEVDHINHDRLDNRKRNLRICTRSENKINRRFPGYHIHKNGKQPERWRVVLRKDKKIIYEKQFKTEDEARSARIEAEQRFFGEFAPKRS